MFVGIFSYNNEKECLMKRAALYIRVSTIEQARHGFSMDEQQYDLMQYAQKKRYVVMGTYIDGGCSARKAISRRKELQRLLLDVQNNKVDIIILKSLDRWFRNVKDFYKVQNILDEHHVEWECTQEDYNTTTANGRLMLNLKLAIAQNESDQTSERIRYIHNAKRRRNEVLNNSHSFGLTIKDKHYVVVEKEKPIINCIYKLGLERNSSFMIKKAVFETFGITLSAKQIRRILRNPIYAGILYGKEDGCPAILDNKKDFYKMQEILAEHKRPVSGGTVYLFKGKIHCPHCGTCLIGATQTQKGKKYIHYKCGNYYSTGGNCLFNHVVSESKIENFLINNIATLLAAYHIQSNKRMIKKEHAKKQINDIKQKLSRLKDLYVDGFIEKETYKTSYEQLQTDLSKAILVDTTTPSSYFPIESMIGKEEFRTVYQSLSREKKQHLWQQFIDHIEILPATLKTGHYSNNFQIYFH